MRQGNHPADHQQHPVPGGRFPLQLPVQHTAPHIQPALIPVQLPLIQPELMAFDAEPDETGIAHIQHGLVAGGVPEGPSG